MERPERRAQTHAMLPKNKVGAGKNSHHSLWSNASFVALSGKGLALTGDQKKVRDWREWGDEEKCFWLDWKVKAGSWASKPSPPKWQGWRREAQGHCVIVTMVTATSLQGTWKGGGEGDPRCLSRGTEKTDMEEKREWLLPVCDSLLIQGVPAPAPLGVHHPCPSDLSTWEIKNPEKPTSQPQACPVPQTSTHLPPTPELLQP